jgi:hypothetical protein
VCDILLLLLHADPYKLIGYLLEADGCPLHLHLVVFVTARAKADGLRVGCEVRGFRVPCSFCSVQNVVERSDWKEKCIWEYSRAMVDG